MSALAAMVPAPTDIVFLTICDHPRDFPDHITMRSHVIRIGHRNPLVAPIAGLYATVDEARADIPQGAVKFARDPQDDPIIVESWML